MARKQLSANITNSFPTMAGKFMVGGYYNGTIFSADKYGNLWNPISQNANDANMGTLCPGAGSITKLYVKSDIAVGLGETLTVTLTKNGVDTALTVPISGAIQTSNSDLVDTVTFTANDVLGWHFNGTAGVSNNYFYFGAVGSLD
jgi:hypothetical protein